MEHTFKLVFRSYPYDLSKLVIRLAVDLGIHLNRSGIGVDTTKKDIISFNVDPFLKEYFGLIFTYRFRDNNPYTDKIYKEDYNFLEEDFHYKQQVLFTFKNDVNIDEENNFLNPLFKIVSSLEEENVHNSLFIYSGPDKSEIIYMKKEGKISVNQSCKELFDGDLIKMSNSYLISTTKPTA